MDAVYMIDIAVVSEPPEEFMSDDVEARFEVYSTMAFDVTGKAVLDIGATATVGSLEALEALMQVKASRGEHETVKVYPDCRRKFRFGNGEVAESLSYIEIPQRLDGKLIYLGIHTMDTSNVPILLDIGRRLVIFQAVNSAVAVRLEESPSGQLLLDLTQDWMATSVPLEDCQSVGAPGSEVSPATQQYVPLESDSALHDPTSEYALAVSSFHEDSNVIAAAETSGPCDSDNNISSSSGPVLSAPPSLMPLSRAVRALVRISPVSQSSLPHECRTSRSPGVREGQALQNRGAPDCEAEEGHKSNNDTAERYDYSRTEGPDLRDPRATGPPCRGHHQPMPFGRGSLSGTESECRVACIAGCVVFG